MGAELKQTETKILDMLIAYYSSLSRNLDHNSTVLQQAMEDICASSPTMTAALEPTVGLVQSTETKASKEREATRHRKLYRLRQEKQENRVPARTSRPRRRAPPTSTAATGATPSSAAAPSDDPAYPGRSHSNNHPGYNQETSSICTQASAFSASWDGIQPHATCPTTENLCSNCSRSKKETRPSAAGNCSTGCPRRFKKHLKGSKYYKNKNKTKKKKNVHNMSSDM